MDYTKILLRPVVTEKATALREEGVYAFFVDPKANRIEIGKAVEEAFKVKVTNVNGASGPREGSHPGLSQGLCHPRR